MDKKLFVMGLASGVSGVASLAEALNGYIALLVSVLTLLKLVSDMWSQRKQKQSEELPSDDNPRRLE